MFYNKSIQVNLLILFLFFPILLISQPKTSLERNKKNSRISHFPIEVTIGFIDSLIYYQYDRYNKYQKHKETFTYNDSNLVTYIFNEIWDGDLNKWVNYSNETRTYDQNYNIIEETGQIWSDGEWENWWKNEYTFDNNGFKLTWQYYNWLLFSGWAKGVKETYSYDEDGNLILKEAVNNFENTWRDSLIYDSQNRLVTYFAEDWVNDQWINDWIETYSYDDDGNLVEILREEWENDQWVDVWKEDHIYNVNNLLSKIEYNFWQDPDQWLTAERALYDYNESGQLIHAKYEGKDGENWILINGLMQFYDSHGNHFYYSRETELIVHYDGVTSVNNYEDNKLDFKLAQNYPNPFNPSTTINFTIPNKSHIILKIYDILGNEISTLMDEVLDEGLHLVRYSPSDLTSGIYFYNLKSENFIESKKMIYLK